MKVVIFGTEGQLGRDLQTALTSYDLVTLTHGDVDVTDKARVAGVLDRDTDWVINAAAMTHVDRCEDEEIAAFEINALGARHVADACRDHALRLIHISTDYVFDGAKKTPYIETDPTRPINTYGITKRSGELYVEAAYPEHYIVRTSGLYGVHACRGKGGRNFVDTMLDLSREKDEIRVVDDEVLTPTFAEDLAGQIRVLIEAKDPPFGIYHATNAGQCSWHDFAAEIFRLSGASVELLRTTTAEWNAPARRPAYCVLENAALKKAGIDSLAEWQDALKRYLDKKLSARKST